MREYKFRGKRLDNGEWAYGFYYFDGEKHWILQRHLDGKFCHADEVDPATVGEFAGLPDKNGREIYEGDRIKFDDTGEDGYEYKEGFDFMNVATVELDGLGFSLTDFGSENSGVMEEMKDDYPDNIAWVFEHCEIIGNTADNPELLQESGRPSAETDERP
jgi:uncharacterized phage protein (TIGR01671 family)